MTGFLDGSVSEAGWDPVPGPRVFSGHESFFCRYGWLPKLYEGVVRDPRLFSSDERAILALGIGRNMVKSLRFWGETFGLVTTRGQQLHVTEFARKLLDPDSGLDPFLETPDSLWRLHWMATVHGGLGAWTIAFLESREREITRERFINAVHTRALQLRGRITTGTVTNHVDVFLRTYAGRPYTEASLEESLGSPFQELGLVSQIALGGKQTIRLLRGPKHGLDTGALAFVLHDFWRGTAAESKTLSLRSLMFYHAAPGMVLLLDESSLHEGLEDICRQTRRLVLRSDGAGGVDLSCKRSPLEDLETLAWQ
ncbi:MAG: DUF4007 family protein [Gammaproteobacteria bacterium]|nr:DUF4007 family protein [Gammaproteobacteria bacterium]